MKAEPKTETHQDTAGVADAHAGQQGRALALGAPDDAVGSGQGVLAHFWFVPASLGKVVNPVGLILGLLMSRIPYKRITAILNQISTIIPHHKRLG